MIPLDDPTEPAEGPDPGWYDTLELWRRGLDQATRPDLRRVVVSQLDPPLSRRATGELPAVGTTWRRPDETTIPSTTPSSRPVNGESPSPPNGANGSTSGVLPRTPMLSMTRGATVAVDEARVGAPSSPASATVVDGLRPTGLVPHPERRRASDLIAARTRARLVRLAWATGLALALALAWFVLVTLRAPGSEDAPVDEIGIRVDEGLRSTLMADRVLSVTGWIATVATTLVLGGVIFRVFVMGSQARTADATTGAATGQGHALQVLRKAAVLGIVAEVASLLLRAAAVSDAGFAAAWDPDILRFVLTGRFGDAALVRIAGLALLAGFLPVLPIGPASRRPDLRGGSRGLDADRVFERLACLAGGLVILVSFAIVGHPQASAPAVLLVPVQWVHVVAVSTWFGGVTFLGLELRRQRRDGSARGFAQVVRRFSSVATVVIFLAGVTGLTMAYSQLKNLDALTTTAYGKALMVKVAVLAVPLALGGYNRQRLVPAIMRRDETSAWRHLRLTLGLEALFIALGVLLATAAMTSGGFQ
jgi:putative copper export protein